MWYWIVMFILIAGSIGMLGVSFSSIKKNKAIAAAREESGGRRRRRRDEEEEEDEYDAPPRRRRRKSSRRNGSAGRSVSGRSFWKILTAGINTLLLFMILWVSAGEKTEACMKNIFRS